MKFDNLLSFLSHEFMFFLFRLNRVRYRFEVLTLSRFGTLIAKIEVATGKFVLEATEYGVSLLVNAYGLF